ncbi:MAG: YajQ family cyclic di-GMP-binding protein [Pseudomonadales bacterium]|nr:YajQ family cyclic di-GMP-binding protein [Pseudomonadales bacterium]
MPSFDAVSEVDSFEISNAVDQANRELSTRYDFRGVDAKFTRVESEVELEAQADIQLEQMLDILRAKLVARKIDVRVLEIKDPRPRGKQILQTVLIRQGIETDLARKIVKLIKAKKMKVQAAIQGEKLRVTGKKRDDLQKVMAFLKGHEDIDVPLQFENFRE